VRGYKAGVIKIYHHKKTKIKNSILKSFFFGFILLII